MTSGAAGVVAIDGGDLSLGGGLLALVRPALTLLGEGGVLALLSRNRDVDHDLPSWCRAERHEYLGAEEVANEQRRHLIGRGRFSALGGGVPPIAPLVPQERLTTSLFLESLPMPDRADPASGFAPRGVLVEEGGPVYPFDLVERAHVAPPEVAALYDQAVAGQWDATRDIPWTKVRTHAPEIDAAIRQIMTFLAENELSALYLPSKFISRIHPAYVEVAMFLATQLQDEARHIDVFLKRARLAAGVARSSVATSQSLLSLLLLQDFSESAFLLSVLGEGTFLDLLSFIERYAPDEATAELVRRARNDESRHVHFGLAHVRHALSHDASLYRRLEAAVRRRAATLAGVSSVPAPVQDALTVLAAGGTDPRRIARGHEAFRELLDTMHQSRIKRLLHAGFDAAQAETISALHTANFM
ncbi:MAG TPA: ferritin-like domain-containing protein [Thermoanaerobaculia bacterium]|nr:ferritin-like domain-containing protein [Thermoanaerobaculia bacterium]